MTPGKPSAALLPWETVAQLRNKLRVTVLQAEVYQFPCLVEEYVSAKNFGGNTLPFTYAELSYIPDPSAPNSEPLTWGRRFESEKVGTENVGHRYRRI